MKMDDIVIGKTYMCYNTTISNSAVLVRATEKNKPFDGVVRVSNVEGRPLAAIAPACLEEVQDRG